ncbi:transposase family protein [Amycolatopsis lurida]
MTVEKIERRQSGVRIWARARSNVGVCRSCGVGSGRVHSRYHRRVADVPIAGVPVVLCLRMRRFFCNNTSCTARTFAEQVEGLDQRTRPTQPTAAADA